MPDSPPSRSPTSSSNPRPLAGLRRHRPPAPGTFAALRSRNYRLFFTGQLVSYIGTWMQNVAQGWLVYSLTGSPLYLGIVSFAGAAPALTLSLGAGVVADRVPKRRLLLLTQCGAMFLALSLAADVFLGWVQPWHIILFSFLLGIVNTFDAPARQAFVVEIVEREDLMNAIALNSAVFNTARILGPSLAGIALSTLGPAWCFLLNGISFVAVLTGLWRMKVKPFTGASQQEAVTAQLREGLAYIWRTASVRTLISLVAVSQLFAFGYSTLMPAFAQDVLQVGPTGLGLLSAAVGVGALTGALLIASLGGFRRRGYLLTLGSLGFPFLAVCYAFSRSFPLSLALLSGIGLGFMVQNMTANTLIQVTVPDALRGRVMSVYTMAMNGLFPVGSLLAGTIAQSFGVPAGAGVGAAVALAYNLFLYWRAPFLRKLE